MGDPRLRESCDGILAVDRMASSRTMCMRSEFEARYRSDSPYR